MKQSEKNMMSCLVYRVRKKGLKVDDDERIIYFSHETPEALETKNVKQLRKKYNFHCQAQIQ